MVTEGQTVRAGEPLLFLDDTLVRADVVGETMWKIPEGYRPLPVREFVVDAEKNDTYILSLGVQDEAIDQNNWILTKYIRGEIFIYNPISGVLLYEISIPKENKISAAAFMSLYNKSTHHDKHKSVYQGFFIIWS
ncbi:TPA: hypothetical protein G9B43_004977 [Salmonella enterica]|nr:hypothetical protein [Salmonella enterica]